MKVLVTGGLGVVGRPVVERLSRSGHTLSVVDRAVPPAAQAAVPGLPPGVALVACDVTDYAAVREAVRGQEAVIHLAAIAQPGGAPAAQLFHLNAAGTFNIYQAAAEEGIRRVVCASSINALGYYYGGVDFPIAYFPIDEEHPTFSTDAYSFSKQVNEATAAYFWRRAGISSACLRLPGVYALTPERVAWLKVRIQHTQEYIEAWQALDESTRQQRLAGLLEKWESIRRQRALQAPREQWAALGYDMQDPEVGVLASRANFWASIHAEDAAQAFEKALLADFEGSHALFVNDEANFALVQAEALARLFFPAVTARKKPLEGIQSLVNIEKAHRLIGFAPEHSLRQYLES
jgi:UDP-glucose 4-epimerase